MQIFHSKRPTYFSKKKLSCLSDLNNSQFKKSTSITYLKKKKINNLTDARNSPVMSSTESLVHRSKSKPKHKRHLTKVSGLGTEKSFSVLAPQQLDSNKGSLFKRKKKTMIARY